MLNNNKMAVMKLLVTNSEMTNGEQSFPNCGVIMATDKSFRVFTNGLDLPRITKNDEVLSPSEKLSGEMFEKCLAISLALANDQIMAVLLDLTRNLDLSSLEANSVRNN